jgi:hypothetical protein
MSEDIYIGTDEYNPTTWAQTCWLRGRKLESWKAGKLESRYRVKLKDGREIFSWWQDGQWSVERLKPHLKVASWKMPVWKA